MKLVNVLNKTIKVLKVVAGVVVTITTVASLSLVIREKLTKNTSTETIEDTIRRIHKEECENIGIDIECVMNTNNMTLASCIYTQYKNFFSIVDIDRAQRIEYNPVSLRRAIESMFLTKKVRRIAGEHMIRHTVRHELRHAWQTIYNKDILMQRHILETATDMVSGYGNRPHEADANKYAEDVDMGMFNVVYKACTFNQNMSGKISQTQEDLAERKEIAKGLLKLHLSLMF